MNLLEIQREDDPAFPGSHTRGEGLHLQTPA